MTAFDAGAVVDAFAPGAAFFGGSRTVTDAEIAFLPALMGAVNPLFHDEVAASSGPLGGRILYGPALLGIAVSLTEHLLRDRVRALLQIDALRFRRAVKAGDTVSASFVVRESRARPESGTAVLTVDDEVRNQSGDLVATFTRTILVAAAQPA